MERTRTLWTVGHSTHPWEAFVAMLQAGGIEAIADVRLLAGSRRHPQFNGDALSGALKAEDINYVALPALGGLRHAHKDSSNPGALASSEKGVYPSYLGKP